MKILSSNSHENPLTQNNYNSNIIFNFRCCLNRYDTKHFQFYCKKTKNWSKSSKYNKTIKRGYHGMHIAIIKSLFPCPLVSGIPKIACPK